MKKTVVFTCLLMFFGLNLCAQSGNPVPVIDSIYYHVLNNGTRVSDVWSHVITYDTTPSGDLVPTGQYWSIDICDGETVEVTAHGDYTNDPGATDATTTFKWYMGDNNNPQGQGLTSVTHRYNTIGCYELSLELVDQNNVSSTIYTSVKVRIAPNPVKEIKPVQSICNNDSVLLDVSFDSSSALLTLTQITQINSVSKENDARTFIPDGPNCAVECYEAPVTFVEFPAGQTITSAEDICSICINYEHSFMGDYRLSIICPNNSKSVLKWGNNGYYNNDPEVPSTAPSGSHSGDGLYAGIPYGGYSDYLWDGDYGEYCDTAYNMYGDGRNYCFSRNGDYTLVDGRAADVPQFNQATPTYLANDDDAYKVTINNYQFRTVPAGYHDAGQTATSSSSFKIKRPSDHDNKRDYYTPYSDFSELIGCPMNGTWKIQICDFWAQDNGWVFSWSLDLCGMEQSMDCQYSVGIDSVVWGPDPLHSDTTADGNFRGLVMHSIDNTNAWMLSPDTAGEFPVLLTVYDEFGCRWDTSTTVTTVWVPKPQLGNDTIICDYDRIMLDATDAHTASNSYSYLWSPDGETSSSITTRRRPGADVEYAVEVTNSWADGTQCKTADTIVVRNYKMPVPAFSVVDAPPEGCEPFELVVNNTSENVLNHMWQFGDSTTSTEAEPVHTYMAGHYDLRYYVYGEGGCVDSIVYPYYIHVYHNPHAAFTWEPDFPTVTNPTIQLVNRTEPMVSENSYLWEIQDDVDNLSNLATLTEVHPAYTWPTDGTNIVGAHLVRLTSFVEEVSPTGTHVRCADTTEGVVMIVNNFIQFPNMITPNGDGVNDRFTIVNLLEGMSYPLNCLDIYNRWGVRVFHKENISKEEDFWDASGVPTGTYFYRFSAKGYNGNIDHNGVVEVVR